MVAPNGIKACEFIVRSIINRNLQTVKNYQSNDPKAPGVGTQASPTTRRPWNLSFRVYVYRPKIRIGLGAIIMNGEVLALVSLLPRRGRGTEQSQEECRALLAITNSIQLVGTRSISVTGAASTATLPAPSKERTLSEGLTCDGFK